VIVLNMARTPLRMDEEAAAIYKYYRRFAKTVRIVCQQVRVKGIVKHNSGALLLGAQGLIVRRYFTSVRLFHSLQIAGLAGAQGESQ